MKYVMTAPRIISPQALAQDLMDWWNSADPAEDDPAGAPGPGQAATLSGATAKQVADKVPCASERIRVSMRFWTCFATLTRSAARASRSL